MNTVIFTTFLPVALLLIHAYRRDKYMKEPFVNLFYAFLFGIMAFPIYFLWIMVYMFLLAGTDEDSFIQIAVNILFITSVPIEFFKLAALWFITHKLPSFNERMDGIVYSVYVSLGFGMIEGLLFYFMGESESFPYMINISIAAVPTNWFLGVLMGYYYSLSMFGEENKVKYGIFAFLIPMLIHTGISIILLALDSIDPMFEGVVFVLMVGLAYLGWKYANKKMDEHLSYDKKIFEENDLFEEDVLEDDTLDDSTSEDNEQEANLYENDSLEDKGKDL